jgi:broad-specificity NMP kinase
VGGVHILRLAGVPGVGKSAVAAELFARFRGAGERVAHVDIDQLGMCYPAPDDDPDRWSLKERALERVARRFHAEGTDLLVVSGVVEPTRPPDASAQVTSYWLDASAATRRRRLKTRGWSEEEVERVVAVGGDEARRAPAEWVRVPTDALSIAETADRVQHLRTLRRRIAEPLGPPQAAGPGRVVWITGARPADASRVGWEMASAAWSRGERTGFVDVAQLSLVAWEPSKIGLENTVEMQALFASIGAETTVVVASVDIDPVSVRQAFAPVSVRFVRSHA